MIIQLNLNNMKALDIMSHISMVLIVLILVGKLAEHTPALLALVTFYFGYCMGKNIDK